MDNTKTFKRIARNLAQLVSLAKMYKYAHPMVVQKTRDTYKDISEFLSGNKQSLVLAKSADMLLINGEKVEPESNLMKKFIEDFLLLDIGSLELEPGVTLEEMGVLILLMCHAEKTSGVDRITQFFSEKKAAHLMARAATFKLVQEDEDIVKKGEFLKIEDIPPEVLKRFSQDLKDGKVPQNLEKSEKEYRLAAHNSTFLAEMAFDLLKEKGEKNTPQDLERILWLMADYLIDEIGSFKEENLNRDVLEDIKTKLLSKWQGDTEKQALVQHMEKTYIVINTAMQLKGLLAIYKKHKKSMDSAAKKIKNIMKDLPTDSQLYQKTVKALADMGEAKFF